MNLKLAEIEAIRITKGGISNDVELYVVEPHEVAHLPDFSEEIVLAEHPSTPGSPYAAPSPYGASSPYAKIASPSPMRVGTPTTPTTPSTPSMTEKSSKPPAKKQKISNTTAVKRSRKKTTETAPKTTTPRKRNTKNKTTEGTKIKLKLPKSNSSSSTASSKDMMSVSESDISTQEASTASLVSTDTTSTNFPSTSEFSSADMTESMEIESSGSVINDRGELLKQKEILSLELKKLEEERNTAQQNQRKAGNYNIKQRFQSIVDRKEEAISSKQAEITVLQQTIDQL